MTLQAPVSPPAIVVPVIGSVARIGSRFCDVPKNGLASDHVTFEVAVLSVAFRVSAPAMNNAAPVLQLTPTDGSPATSGSPSNTGVRGTFTSAAETTKAGVPLPKTRPAALAGGDPRPIVATRVRADVIRAGMRLGRTRVLHVLWA